MKNIDDIGYEKQLNVYKDFILKAFNKNVNLYLYSLLTGEFKKI